MKFLIIFKGLSLKQIKQISSEDESSTLSVIKWVSVYDSRYVKSYTTRWQMTEVS